MENYKKTIKKLKTMYSDLDAYVKAKIDEVSDDNKEVVDELLKKTKEAIDLSIDKINEAVNFDNSEEELNEFLNKVSDKAEEAIDFSKAKIEMLINEVPKQDLDEVFANLESKFNEVKESDTFKKATKFIKGVGVSINEYLEKPEVQEKINKAKVTTINIAEKGVEELKKILNTDEKTVEDVVDLVDEDDKK